MSTNNNGNRPNITDEYQTRVHDVYFNYKSYTGICVVLWKQNVNDGLLTISENDNKQNNSIKIKRFKKTYIKIFRVMNHNS